MKSLWQKDKRPRQGWGSVWAGRVGAELRQALPDTLPPPFIFFPIRLIMSCSKMQFWNCATVQLWLDQYANGQQTYDIIMMIVHWCTFLGIIRNQATTRFRNIVTYKLYVSSQQQNKMEIQYYLYLYICTCIFVQQYCTCKLTSAIWLSSVCPFRSATSSCNWEQCYLTTI